MAIRPSDYMGHNTGSYQVPRHRNSVHSWNDSHPLTAEELASAMAFQREVLSRPVDPRAYTTSLPPVEPEPTVAQPAKSQPTVKQTARQKARYRKWKAWYEEHKQQQREAKQAGRQARKEATL